MLQALRASRILLGRAIVGSRTQPAPSFARISPSCRTSMRIPQGLRFYSEAVSQRPVQATSESPSEIPAEQLAKLEKLTRFDELIKYNLVDSHVVETITNGFGYEAMTPVQSATIKQALAGTDMIAQARTGTGKTLGFLVPTIQNILRKNPELAGDRRRRGPKAASTDIRAIIVSPTRELAEQIAAEASKLCRYTHLKVQVAVGGNSKRAMLRKTQMEGCHILVATPGRLNDLLTDPYSRIAAPKLNTLILDEADRLLDQGFAPDIEKIMEMLPDPMVQDRQTLMFSATVPNSVMHLVRSTLKPDFQFVQTVQQGEPATHEKVPQRIVEVPGLENLMPALLELLKRSVEASINPAEGQPAGPPFKAMVFFGQTKNVLLSSQIFKIIKADARRNHHFSRSETTQSPLMENVDVLEIHAQLSQDKRTMAAERFRRAKSAILFSTDVTARGMDFPNVSHVIQIGLPQDRDSYIHRLGRTGRGDKTGEGWILIHSSEINDARRMLRELPIKRDTSIEAAKVDMTQDADLPASVAATLSEVANGTKLADEDLKAGAYLAAIGISKGTAERVASLAQWTRYGWGWEKPPPVSRSFASRLRIDRLPGVNIDDGRKKRSDDFGDEFSSGSDNSRGNDFRRSGRGNSFGGRDEGSRDSRFGRDRNSGWERNLGRDGFGREKNYGRGGNSNGRSRQAQSASF